jgi:NAD(P)-dependent dehydrogenase (short-subunit alcohol dehydrogenase family)
LKIDDPGWKTRVYHRGEHRHFGAAAALAFARQGSAVALHYREHERKRAVAAQPANSAPDMLLRADLASVAPHGLAEQAAAAALGGSTSSSTSPAH